MISIQCHRVGEWSAGKPEFENGIDSGQGNQVDIPFKSAKECNLQSLTYFPSMNNVSCTTETCT